MTDAPHPAAHLARRPGAREVVASGDTLTVRVTRASAARGLPMRVGGLRVVASVIAEEPS